jgi:hypothetical protein
LVFSRGVAASALLVAASAQDLPLRFVPERPMVRIGIHGVPALRAALPDTRLGRLFADPEVAAAIEIGRRNYAARIARWQDVHDRLHALAPGQTSGDALVQGALFALDWRDVAAGELIATRDPDQPQRVQTTLLVEPVAAAEGRWEQRFLTLLGRLRQLAADTNPSATQRVGSERIGDHPGLVLVPRDAAADAGFEPEGDWLLHLPGQFAGGDGSPELAGACAPAAPRRPGVALELDFAHYVDLFAALADARDPAGAALLRATGLDTVRRLLWELRFDGALLHDEIALELDAPPHGLLGALLDGVAPPVAQPLPEHALLQLRGAIDTGALFAAIDDWLVASELPTLAQLGLAEDLKRAWTGGVALAVAHPAAGGFVPRLYASFGIADAAAFERLAARLGQLPDVAPRQVRYQDQPCVQLRIAGMPSVWQPSYCLQDGVVHFAESGLALRALLKAQAAGAPPALDVGDAPAPAGPGALPGFELRFDGAAIHAAVQQLWVPLGSALLAHDPVGRPLVPAAELPSVEAAAAHLRPGRGVLRRTGNRVALAMIGTAGGPELHALLAAYGPLLSGPLTSEWHRQTEAAQYEIGKLQLPRIHAALAAFRARHGRLPASLGELVASGELADPSLLAIAGDDATEPVVHDGKEVARTSFRYHGEDPPVAVEGEAVVARLTALRPLQWRTLVLGDDGTVHDTWGDAGFPAAAVELVETEVVVPPAVDDAPPRNH